MGFLDRFRVKNQAQPQTHTATTTLGDILGINIGGTIPTSGMVSDSLAQKHSIVYACTRIIAGSIGQCPLRCYEGTDGAGGDAARIRPDLEALWNREPNRGWSGQTMVEHLVHRMLLRGNGFAVILREGIGGEIVGLRPLEAWQVHAGRQTNGEMVYLVYDDFGATPTPYDSDDILHFANFPVYDGIGSSVISTGASTALNIAHSAEQRAMNAFVKGVFANLVITREGGWSEEAKDKFRKQFEEKYGGVDSSDSPIIKDSKTTIDTLDLSPADSQLLESREYQVTDIARAFGVASYLVNQEAKNTSFGSGVQRIAEGFTRFTLTPIIRRFEQELTRKFFIGQPTRYCQLDTSGLTRATMLERYAMYMQALGGNGISGHMSVNDVREAENKPRLERLVKVGDRETNVFDEVYTGFDAPGGAMAATETALQAAIDEETQEIAAEMTDG